MVHAIEATIGMRHEPENATGRVAQSRNAQVIRLSNLVAGLLFERARCIGAFEDSCYGGDSKVSTGQERGF